MTISTQNRTAGPFAGNDATTVFPFNFKVFSAKELLAVSTEESTSASDELKLNKDYTVTLNGDQDANPGGSVILKTALAAGYSLVLTSQVEYLQPLDLTNQGGFYPKIITTAFDRITILLQQLNSIASRSLRFPVADIGANTELPQRSRRANNLLGFDQSGNPVAFAPAAQSATALQIEFAKGIGATLIGYLQAGAGALSRTLQDRLRDTVSVKDFGARGDGVTNDTTALNKAFAYIQSVGGELWFPRGVYLTDGGHALTANGIIVSLRGTGPKSSILKCTGGADLLTITGASECAVRGIGLDKVVQDRTGDGLKMVGLAYALVDHVSAYGFANGFKTEGVLTTLFIKPLARLCEIGMYLVEGANSYPNAITLINPSFSLNGRWGLRASKPASLQVLGGSCEGNGWLSPGFNGGVYIANAGGEGGVGVSIMGLHMEQNHGSADIHIAATMYEDTVYNIQNCPIFPIDMLHITQNTIYLENSVRLTLNVHGNNFKHIGPYVPDASRKYIKAEAPTLATVNTCGDTTQFYSAVQTPDLGAWGPNVCRGSMFSARGSVAINGASAAVITGAPYNLASALRTGTGEITCNYTKPMKDDDYQVLVNPTSGAKTDFVISKTANYFTVQFRDMTGTLVDSGFDFMVAGGI